MSYLVLARKYRPGTFEEIIGQKHVTRTLKNAISRGKIHHAFLFTGTRGVGKTTCARVLAKALCCLSSDKPTDVPCGTCVNCLAIEHGNSIDVNEIDGASNNSVNDIRDLRDSVQYRPQQTRYKIYIIDEVHMLTNSAFNALLKTLEEPPEHVKFIFATTESHKIPQTILSRCQRYDFKSVSAIDLSTHMKSLLKSEGVEISDQALQMIARQARGSVRDGLSLMDSVIAYSDEKVSEEDVRTVLGMADAAIFERIVKALIKRDGEDVFDSVAELVDFGHDLRQFGNDFLEYLRDLVLLSCSPASSKQLTRPDIEIKALLDLARERKSSQWIAWFELMVEGQNRIARSEQARFMLELTLAKMLELGELKPIEDLLSGLGKLIRSQKAGQSITGNRGSSPRASSRDSSPRQSENNAANAAVIDINDHRSEDGQASQNLEVPKDLAELVERLKPNRVLWNAMLKVRKLKFTDELITLECPKNDRAYKTLTSTDGYKVLLDSVRKIMGSQINIKIEAGEWQSENTVSISEKRKIDASEHRRQSLKMGEKDETVLMIREVFGGGKTMVKTLARIKKG